MKDEVIGHIEEPVEGKRFLVYAEPRQEELPTEEITEILDSIK